MKLILSFLPAAIGIAGGLAVALGGQTAQAQGSIDNSALEKSEFRAHKATYGLVYKLPKDVTDVLDAKINGPVKAQLLKLGLVAETNTFNLPHVTVVHIHNGDPTTPAKMLKALPKPPAPLSITLKDFYNTEAAKDAGHPWWLDLGIVKSGKGFEDMMSYNTAATAALTPLRDGPLPRCTGPVFAKMSDVAKELTKTMGVSGVNVMKDGKETSSHNPHNTLVYSMAKFDAPLQASMKEFAGELNKILPEGIASTFKDVSIVEIGFSGNVLREFYRISLETGAGVDVATGQPVQVGTN